MHISMTEGFVESLAALGPGDGRRAAAFLHRLIRTPEPAALRSEIVHTAGDRSIRSFRVTRELRAIGHLEGDDLVLMFVGQHDAAYAWAHSHCVECHPVTREIQVIADPGDAERVLAAEEAAHAAERIATSQPPAAGLFEGHTDEYLLSIGVPPSWLPTVRMIRSEEMLLAVAPDLPDAVAERLVRLATGDLVGPVCVNQRCPDADEVDMDSDVRHWICTVTDGESLCQLLEDVGIEALPDA